MSDFAPPELSPGNDFDVYARLTKRSSTTPRVRVAATGLTVTAFLALTLGGAAIAGTTVNCAEVGTDGEYLGTITGTALTTALAALTDGQTIYLAIQASTNVLRWEPCTVRKYPSA